MTEGGALHPAGQYAAAVHVQVLQHMLQTPATALQVAEQSKQRLYCILRFLLWCLPSVSTIAHLWTPCQRLSMTM